jgi:hypothetical protein
MKIILYNNHNDKYYGIKNLGLKLNGVTPREVV